MAEASLDSLSWIKDELERLLETARHRLNAYAEEPEERNLLAEYVRLVHQVVGTLTLVSVRGARLLAEHMERLGRAFLEGRLPVDTARLEPLMRASIELSDYLDRVVNGMRDSPTLVLSRVNELRTALGEPALDRERLRTSATRLKPAAEGEDAVSLAARFRLHFQAALLSFYRGEQSARALGVMRAALARIETNAVIPAVFEFFWIAGGVIEALIDGGVAPGIGVKRLLGQVEREIKRLAAGSEAAFAEEPPEALIEEMLAHIELSSSRGERVSAIRTNFQLSSEAEGSSSAPAEAGSELLRSVGRAILEDLSQVRDRIDIYVRSRSQDPGELAPLGDILKKVADALGMLGVSEIQSQVRDEQARLRGFIAAERVPDHAELMALAMSLIRIESDVEAYLSGSGRDPGSVVLRNARAAGLREVLADISRLRDVITVQLREAGSIEAWAGLPFLADRLARALEVLTLEDTACLIRRLARYLERVITAGSLPERLSLDRLADAVVSVEYYLETLQRGREGPVSMLENASMALDVLGVGKDLGEKPAWGRSGTGVVSLSQGEATDASTAASVKPIIDHATETYVSPPESLPTLGPASVVPGPLPPVREPGAEDEIVEIFLEEAEEVGAELAHQYRKWRDTPQDHEALGIVRRAFHTLKGSGRLVGAALLGEFAWSYENLLNRVLDYTLEPTPVLIDSVGEAVAGVPHLVAQFAHGIEPPFDIAALIGRARAMSRGEEHAVTVQENAAKGLEPMPAGTSATTLLPEPSAEPLPRLEPKLYGIFRDEANQHLHALRQWAESIRDGKENQVNESLCRAVHTLAGSASMAGVAEVHALAERLDETLDLVTRAKCDARDCVTTVLATATAIDALVAAYGDRKQPIPSISSAEESLAALNRAALSHLEEAEAPEAEAPEAEVPGAEVAPLGTAQVVNLHESKEYDPDLVQVFLGEAGELLDGADVAIHAWIMNHDLTEPLMDLQRRLHTLKGGARMAGITPIADLAHELEHVLVQVADGRLSVSSDLLHMIERTLDRLQRMHEYASSTGKVPFDQTMMASLHQHSASLVESMIEEDQDTVHEFLQEALNENGSGEAAKSIPGPSPGAAIEPEGGRLVAGGGDEHAIAGDRERRDKPRVRHALARVRTDLLEGAINNAGEVSIYRGRIDQQLLNMNLHLVELERTVDRIRQQLRELELETEAQILSNYEQKPESSASEFDPLEFDRYTRIHELSRFLAEAVSDLGSLRSLFATDLRQASVLLDRQGRINADLQDALLRTRMVPFSLSAPRLRRIVRQVADESGKKAELYFRGFEGELDRQVLEHILPAIEHVLRNAVVHGIEFPAERRQRGKPESGRIELIVHREGSDLIVEITDDGLGLDLVSIRAKAEQQGLIGPQAELTDRQVAELIFRPGFTTATTLTQSAGRGVGMDVVASEARRLGGQVELEWKPFSGTLIRLRLPVTLAITQTLLTRVGHVRYPIPLAGIIGVARISRVNLESILATEKPAYEYGGDPYEVVLLADVLGEDLLGPEEKTTRVSLLLAAAGGRRVAFVVDDMMGSREVVVKTVGPQIARVPGIAGATIFGDGSIGLLLDLNALVRSIPEAEMRAPMPVVPRQTPAGKPLVLVVDDSITVRRVTQRLLERHGARVLTAKDGVEALELLQDHTPGVVLLDIEMPRMDGYELAGHMKNDVRLREIPIIIITSRTGEKHQARARQIGIDNYLGKPYQEAELLNKVQRILGGRLDFMPEQVQEIDNG